MAVAAKAQTFTKTITIKMPEEGGSNGASVAWHPIQKKYFAAMAGNAVYGLVITNAKGETLSKEDQQTNIDVRGLWYNAKSRSIEGNTYSDNGWFRYKLTINGNGVEDKPIILKEGQNQPNEQSLGVFDSTNRLVYFLDYRRIYVQHIDSADYRELISIEWTDDEDELENEDTFADKFNVRAMAYTGIKGKEFAIVNYEGNELWFVNKANGKITEKVQLPNNIKTYGFFNFSYTNKQYFFFDKDTRTWTGYRLNKATATKSKAKA